MPPNKKRCAADACKKKLRLSEEILCKCDNYYCVKQRYANEHNCSYDYKKEWQAKLKKDNPHVQQDKVIKI